MAHTALVTGAGSGIGIGKALATALAWRGSLVICADLSAEAAERTATDLGQHAAQVDVRDRDAVRELIERTDRYQDGLDLMVNKSGTGVGGAIPTLTADHWRAQLEVNLYGVIHGIEAAYPLTRARGRGRICSTGSLSGLIPAPSLGPSARARSRSSA